jgi:hypothetical protein
MANFKNWLQMAVYLMGVNVALAHWNRGKVKTLFYHNVLPNTAAFPDALTPAEFENQLVLIKQKYNPVHLDESGAIVGFAPDRINVLITFDDGFINNYEYVFPILVKHGLKATFFLIVDCLEAESTRVIAERYSRATEEARTEYRTVSLSQIQEMMAAGMTFGSHTFSHTDLAQTEWAEGISIASGSAERLGTLNYSPFRTGATSRASPKRSRARSAGSSRRTMDSIGWATSSWAAPRRSTTYSCSLSCAVRAIYF